MDALPQHWGPAARGVTVESGTPDFNFQLAQKHEVRADEAIRLYATAEASQWDPNMAITWNEPFDLPGEVEDAVMQIMTYLVENETVALVVPSRFVANCIRTSRKSRNFWPAKLPMRPGTSRYSPTGGC